MVLGNVIILLRNIVNGGDGNFFLDLMVVEGFMYNFGDFDDWVVCFVESMMNLLCLIRLIIEVLFEGEEFINREVEGIC